MLYQKVFGMVAVSLVITLACLPLTSCAEKKVLINDYEKPKSQTTKALVYSPGTIQELASPKMKSGPTTSVPWETDEDFLRSQAENGTPILMAAYRTVLHDPLPGEEENVHLAARILAGTVVKPGTVFSQNNKVGPYVRSKGFQKGPTYAGMNLVTTVGGGVCKIASTLYNVAILSNLPIMERHAHSMPVPYVPYGQDATVASGVKDFRFKNNTESPVLIWAKGIDNTLYIAFYGTKKPPIVEWHHKTLKVIKAEKIYKTNPALPAETPEKLLVEGMDGGIVKSWITIKNPDGTITTKQLGKSWYDPMHYLFERPKR